MNKLYSVTIGVFAVTLIASAAQADGPDTSAQGLLLAWKGEDPGMRMVAEVIASAFASLEGYVRREGSLLPSARIKRRPSHDHP